MAAAGGGVAIGVGTVVAGIAAFHPLTHAAPVEYVRVCSAKGVGYVYIPGITTCENAN